MKRIRMRICLIGLFNTIINDKVKKNDKNYVKTVLIGQLYNDIKKMLKYKTPKECQSFINEFIDFYCIENTK